MFNARAETLDRQPGLPRRVQAPPLPRPGRRVLRVEARRHGPPAVRDRPRRRPPARPRRPVGGLEGPGSDPRRRHAAHVHDRHDDAERGHGRPPRPDAGRHPPTTPGTAGSIRPSADPAELLAMLAADRRHRAAHLRGRARSSTTCAGTGPSCIEPLIADRAGGRTRSGSRRSWLVSTGVGGGRRRSAHRSPPRTGRAAPRGPVAASAVPSTCPRGPARRPGHRRPSAVAAPGRRDQHEMGAGPVRRRGRLVDDRVGAVDGDDDPVVGQVAEGEPDVGRLEGRTRRPARPAMARCVARRPPDPVAPPSSRPHRPTGARRGRRRAASRRARPAAWRARRAAHRRPGRRRSWR